MARYAFPADKEKNVVPIDYEKMNAHKSQYLDRWTVQPHSVMLAAIAAT
jgi:hypothetical protein